MNNALSLKNILVSRRDGRTRRIILDIPSFQLAAGDTVCLHGVSGSGKTSLLQLLGGLTTADPAEAGLPSGEVRWGDVCIDELSESERDLWRSQHVGFVFQDFQLGPGLSALENVLLPVTFRSWSIPGALRDRARTLLQTMDIHQLDQQVHLLSRGEMQRVAIARAVLSEPDILLADEPTASLDKENAEAVTRLLLDYAREHACTLILVSHEPNMRGRTRRSFLLERGELHETTSDAD